MLQDGATVSFLQSGAGAVERTVEDKGQESVSVFDFMSAAQKADVKAFAGLTDVSAAVQRAVNALPSRGGAILLLPGRNLFSSGVVIDKAGSVTLQGCGGLGNNSNAATQIYFTGTGPAITLGNSSSTSHNGHHLSKLYIEGNNSAGQIGIRTYRVNSNTFEMVRVNEMLGAGSIGFDFDGTGDATIINEMRQCGVRKVTTGIRAKNTTSLRISGGYYNAVGGTTGLDVVGFDTPILSGANFDGWTVAVDTSNATAPLRGVRAIGNRFENNAVGIKLGPQVSEAACVANWFSLGGSYIGIDVDPSVGDVYLYANSADNIGTGAKVHDPKGRSYGGDSPMATPNQLLDAGFARINTNAALSTAVAGSGSVGQFALLLDLQTGTTSGSSALARTGAECGWSQGQAYNVINWSKRVAVELKITRVGSGSANGRARYTLGKTNGGVIGDLAAKGIGITFEHGSPVAAVHDGSTLTTGSMGAAIDNNTHAYLIVSNGAGSVDFWIDGVLKASISGGPTGLSTAGNCVFQAEVSNGADAVNTQFYMHDCRVWVEQ